MTVLGNCSHCEKDIYEKDKYEYTYCTLLNCEGRDKSINIHRWVRPIMCRRCSWKNNHCCKPCMKILNKCMDCEEELPKTEFGLSDCGNSFVNSICKECLYYKHDRMPDSEKMKYIVRVVKHKMKKYNIEDDFINFIFNKLNEKRYLSFD